jgi:hypothetical protein
MTNGTAVCLVDFYNLDRVSREGSTNNKALSSGCLKFRVSDSRKGDFLRMLLFMKDRLIFRKK